jgi:hypothetical protein
VPDDDSVVADQDLLDQQSDHALTLDYVESFGGRAQTCSAAIWMGRSGNQDGNPVSRHRHDCRGVIVAQAELRF